MGDPEFERWADRIRRAFEALPNSSYYEVLAVSEKAPQEEIRQAFHRRATHLHPDRHRATPKPARDHVYAVFKRMTEAFRTLVDPELRRAYDEGLREGRLRLTNERSVRKQSREEMLHTPGGMRHYKAATDAIAAGDRNGALLNLQLAINYEGTLPLLVELMDQAKKIKS